jgi:hypothetical protein
LFRDGPRQKGCHKVGHNKPPLRHVGEMDGLAHMRKDILAMGHVSGKGLLWTPVAEGKHLSGEEALCKVEPSCLEMRSSCVNKAGTSSSPPRGIAVVVCKEKDSLNRGWRPRILQSENGSRFWARRDLFCSCSTASIWQSYLMLLILGMGLVGKYGEWHQ